MVSGQATIFHRGSNIYCTNPLQQTPDGMWLHETAGARYWINDGSWEKARDYGQPLLDLGLWVTIEEAIDRYFRMEAADRRVA